MRRSPTPGQFYDRDGIQWFWGAVHDSTAARLQTFSSFLFYIETSDTTVRWATSGDCRRGRDARWHRSALERLGRLRSLQSVWQRLRVHRDPETPDYCFGSSWVVRPRVVTPCMAFNCPRSSNALVECFGLGSSVEGGEGSTGRRRGCDRGGR